MESPLNVSDAFIRVGGDVAGPCTHNTIDLAFVFVAIDAWTGEEAFLFVDNVLVWSKSISNVNVGDGGCGGPGGDSIEFKVNLMIPHRERQMTVEFRTSLANAGGPFEASWVLSFFAGGALCSGRNVSADRPVCLIMVEIHSPAS
jgi:hypothetical protein